MSYLPNNKCDICLNKDICKHYQYFRDNFEITVEVKDCSKLRAETTYNKTRTSHIANENITLLNNKVFPDLKEFSKMPPTSLPSNDESKVTPVTISKSLCDRCQKQIPSIDIDNCIECGRQVCKDCSVTSINTSGMPECTCEKCWSGTPDPDPNNPEEVTITYGEDNKEWDLEDFETNKEEKNESGKSKQVGDKTPTRKSKKK